MFVVPVLPEVVVLSEEAVLLAELALFAVSAVAEVPPIPLA